MEPPHDNVSRIVTCVVPVIVGECARRFSALSSNPDALVEKATEEITRECYFDKPVTALQHMIDDLDDIVAEMLDNLKEEIKLEIRTEFSIEFESLRAQARAPTHPHAQRWV
jgi:hypothetical protein